MRFWLKPPAPLPQPLRVLITDSTRATDPPAPTGTEPDRSFGAQIRTLSETLVHLAKISAIFGAALSGVSAFLILQHAAAYGFQLPIPSTGQSIALLITGFFVWVALSFTVLISMMIVLWACILLHWPIWRSRFGAGYRLTPEHWVVFVCSVILCALAGAALFAQGLAIKPLLPLVPGAMLCGLGFSAMLSDTALVQRSGLPLFVMGCILNIASIGYFLPEEGAASRETLFQGLGFVSAQNDIVLVKGRILAQLDAAGAPAAQEPAIAPEQWVRTDGAILWQFPDGPAVFRLTQGDTSYTLSVPAGDILKIRKKAPPPQPASE
ncbi:hypothetical protein [Thioclava sp. GXIMD4215]|uniref:hypothetical protein n=1 Tax=Thioclava sp. GXIMD4215 TaxID=3131928 RepID=UPI003249308A